MNKFTNLGKMSPKEHFAKYILAIVPLSDSEATKVQNKPELVYKKTFKM